MNKQDLYKLDDIIYQQIQAQKKQKENENKAYFEGMEKGADLMMKKVRDFLNEEEIKVKIDESTNKQ